MGCPPQAPGTARAGAPPLVCLEEMTTVVDSVSELVLTRRESIEGARADGELVVIVEVVDGWCNA